LALYICFIIKNRTRRIHNDVCTRRSMEKVCILQKSLCKLIYLSLKPSHVNGPCSVIVCFVYFAAAVLTVIEIFAAAWCLRPFVAPDYCVVNTDATWRHV